MHTATLVDTLNEMVGTEHVNPSLRKRLEAGKSVLANVTSHLKRTSQKSLYDVQEALLSHSCLSSHGVRVRKSVAPSIPRLESSLKPLEIVWKSGSVVRSVSVHGTWSEPPWIEGIDLVLDPTDGYYKVDLSERNISPGTYMYKFVVDGKWCVDQSSPTQSDVNGFINNCIFVRSTARPSLKTVRSAPTSGFDIPMSSPTTQSVLRRIPSILHYYEDSTTRYSSRKTSGLRLMCGAWMIPHPDKMSSGGADSFFYSPRGAGVADGVGEWEWRFNLDPRKFAQELMQGCLAEIEKSTDRGPVIHNTSEVVVVSSHSTPSASSCSTPSVSGGSDTPMSPAGRHHLVEQKALSVLESGYRQSAAFGSSTACVCVVDDLGERIGVSNLGDSGLIHFRRQMLTGSLSTTCVMRTREQQHSFNMPFQLSRLPSPEQYDEVAASDPKYSTLINALRAISGRQLSKIDQPRDAELYSARIKEGDLIILASDGVLDNLWNYDLLSLVAETASVSPFDARISDNQRTTTPPEEIAKQIAQAAFEKSCMQTGYKSPFGVECRKRTGAVHQGGKLDDITVVACWVARGEDLENSLKTQKNFDYAQKIFQTSLCTNWWRRNNCRVKRILSTEFDDADLDTGIDLFSAKLPATT